MLKGLDKLPLARAEYYKRLHDRLVEINFYAVNAGNWQRVIDAARLHIDLQLYLDMEVEYKKQSSALDAGLMIIDDFCSVRGWC